MSTFRQFSEHVRVALPDAKADYYDHIDLALERVCSRLNLELPYPPWNNVTLAVNTWQPSTDFAGLHFAQLSVAFAEVRSVLVEGHEWQRVSIPDLLRAGGAYSYALADNSQLYVKTDDASLVVTGWTTWTVPTREAWQGTLIDHDVTLALIGIKMIYDMDNPSERTPMSEAVWMKALEDRQVQWGIRRMKGKRV